MPPAKKNTHTLVESWIKNYPGQFMTDGIDIFCEVCHKRIPSTKKYQIDQHVRTAAHIAAMQKSTRSRQQLQTQISPNSDTRNNIEFNQNLCDISPEDNTTSSSDIKPITNDNPMVNGDWNEFSNWPTQATPSLQQFCQQQQVKVEELLIDTELTSQSLPDVASTHEEVPNISPQSPILRDPDGRRERIREGREITMNILRLKEEQETEKLAQEKLKTMQETLKLELLKTELQNKLKQTS